MAIYSDLVSAADHIGRVYCSFEGHTVRSGCANVRVFDSMMRVFEKMSTSDIDCGFSFQAGLYADGRVRVVVVTLYKLPDGRPELREHIADY